LSLRMFLSFASACIGVRLSASKRAFRLPVPD
jgi:hypothetical protein